MNIVTKVPGPEDLIGTFRRFGPVGPVYQIVDTFRQLEDGDAMMKVRVIETGEEVEYRYTDILDDPKEK